jgi:CheY-like chemotaxis protein
MQTREQQPAAFRIFLAEDDGALRTLIAQALARDGHAVIEAENGETMLFRLLQAGLQWRGLCPPDALVVCDLRMPICDGLTLLRELRERSAPCPPFIFTTAFPGAAVLREAYELGALRVFEKPFDIDDLRALVREHAGRASS